MMISFEWTGEHFDIAGRGRVYTAMLAEPAYRKDISTLYNQILILPNGKRGLVRGIEMAAIGDSLMHRSIGLLITEVSDDSPR